MEDAISLAEALRVEHDIDAALAAYEAVRRPEVRKVQRSSAPSLIVVIGAPEAARARAHR